MTINHLNAIIVAALIIAVVTNMSAPVYAQITGISVGTKEWCEKKNDELKARLTDLMLSGFAKNSTYNTGIDIRDKGNVLVAETEQQITNCAEHLTSTEMQTLEQMYEASVFFSCLADTSLNAHLINQGVYNATKYENGSFAERNTPLNASTSTDPYSMLTACITSYPR